MPVTNYHTLNGELLGETGPGGRRFYGKDALGSVVATYDQNGTLENTYRYKPYGGLLSKTGSAPDPRFMWTGSTGSRTTGASYAEQYNRTNHYAPRPSAWVTVGPNRSGMGTEAYAVGNPVKYNESHGPQRRLQPVLDKATWPLFVPCPTGTSITYWPSMPSPTDYPKLTSSGHIFPGSGSTACNYGTKVPFIAFIDPTCACQCLFLHEYTHVQQISKCCSSTVLRTDLPIDAALAQLDDRFKRGYLQPNRDIFECSAYTKEHACLLRLRATLIEKQRTGSLTRLEQLCMDDDDESIIAGRIRSSKDAADRHCRAAASKRETPCPTFTR